MIKYNKMIGIFLRKTRAVLIATEWGSTLEKVFMAIGIEKQILMILCAIYLNIKSC